MTAVINLPWLGSPTDELWEELLILSAKTKRVPWMLIGGQMMLLHTLEHGREPLQVSQDGDAIADIRARPDALLAFVRALESEDFESDGMSPDGRAHRYKHKTFDPPVLVDVLAPDNVGPRANLTTTPPGRTVEVPGGTQALHRVEEVEVVLASGSRVSCPAPICSEPSSSRQVPPRWPNVGIATSTTSPCCAPLSLTLSRCVSRWEAATSDGSAAPENRQRTTTPRGRSSTRRTALTASPR